MMLFILLHQSVLIDYVLICAVHALYVLLHMLIMIAHDHYCRSLTYA